MKNLHEFFSRRKWLLAIPILVVAAVIGCVAAANQSVRVGEQRVSRKASALDLRSEALTLSDYTELQKELPQCDILWSVPVGASRFSSDSESLPVQAMTEQDAAALDYFPRLQSLDARDCTDYGTIAALLAHRPDLTCQLTVAGETVSSDAVSLSIPDASLTELQGILSVMKQLQHLELTGTIPAVSDLKQLQWAHPTVMILWEVSTPAGTVPSSTTNLDLSSVEMDYASAEAMISQLPLLEEADMRGCGLSDEEMIRLTQTFPQTLFIWDMEVAGLRFPTNSTEIDISGQQVSDPEEVESVLACFPRLERVIMSDCGLDNETMDALNQRHEQIRFVWTLYFRGHPVRTDALYFYPHKMDPSFARESPFWNAELYPLRYCTDMVSIDLGHNQAISTIEWAAFMPNLRYLILTECAVTDLSPLVNCKNLVYLEVAACRFLKDLSPLVECTALENINLGDAFPDPEALSKMPWLQHVWWYGAKATFGLPCTTAEELLTETIPDTILLFDGTHPADGGWREFQTYYDMRDIMVMYYLR